MAAPKLSHTIQTTVGMIEYDGAPIDRRYHVQGNNFERRFEESLVCVVRDGARIWRSGEATYDLFSRCVLENRCPNIASFSVHNMVSRRIPGFAAHHNRDVVSRLQYNILSCRDVDVDINVMKRFLVSQIRLDLEQAAALVLSAIVNDKTISMREAIVDALIKSIDHSMLVYSSMWMDPFYFSQPHGRKFSRLVDLTAKIVSEQDVQFGEARTWAAILPILLRVRRCRPSDKTRCLHIPQWAFDAANIDPPDEYAIWDADAKILPGHEPVSAAPSDAIILPRKAFRSLQRRLLAYYRFWDPSIALRSAIHDLEDDVLYSASAIKRKVLPSNDTLLVAQYFMAVQRRLQRRIVSDENRTFLAKGESSRYLQNTPHIPTAFEVILSQASGQKTMPIAGAVLPQIDECCLLMERYVAIHGGGDRNKLVFNWDSHGGSGRGPVNDYNLLCDILAMLRRKANDEEGKAAPGAVRKFLAKDILHYNNSWTDDAFADGIVPGWEPWLEMRRAKKVLLSEWEGIDEKADMMEMDIDTGIVLPIR